MIRACETIGSAFGGCTAKLYGSSNVAQKRIDAGIGLVRRRV
jgi:hypothetical protein